MNKEEILNWLSRNDRNYSNNEYIINDDMSVDVKGTVNISYKKLIKIPFQFNIINGHFSCCNNPLTSLHNCPKEVHGHFSCQYNELKSLKGIQYIKGELLCDDHLKDSILYKSFQLMKQLQK